MDCEKIGSLICSLRKEKNLTQKELAEKLYITPNAVSKWERGLGCPDVSLLTPLANVLGAHLKDLLEGELLANQKDTGDLRKVRFHICSECGNILTSTGSCAISCCGRVVEPSVPREAVAEHSILIEQIDTYHYVSLNHGMSKTHHIAFIALLTDETLWLHRLYAEQDAATSFPSMSRGGMLYAYCTEHGLFKRRVSF